MSNEEQNDEESDVHNEFQKGRGTNRSQKSVSIGWLCKNIGKTNIEECTSDEEDNDEVNDPKNKDNSNNNDIESNLQTVKGRNLVK